MAERLGRELIRAVAGCDAADQTATLNSAGCQRDSLLATSPAGLAKARFSLLLLPVVEFRIDLLNAFNWPFFSTFQRGFRPDESGPLFVSQSDITDSKIKMELCHITNI
jgi:hypothetical protein